ncbi:ABC transporter substrate-binding protein [Cryptosporangium arvum]|uniref:Carbohydrate ABC transporter substrate-binding protein, CUT1 family n=1 Tax=Cryptosporangium arvum DSM 44712 TaxID=927661 RepID=A0A010ZS11_9ACTN|nr:sugar ABC transporter substrate-binding protein [Cryptosporangium arvum]EXG81449.1 carbohydrate ABC transporter substrate-binding protein, CUT1 family [Cryptosporangium arvum DSM 44712]
MFKRRIAAVAAAGLLASTLAACGGGDSGSDAKTLTYWASNQSISLDKDAEILKPELAKFEKQTGIKVKFEVVPWSDLLNRLLAAATSGQGPDVVNIGNTWSASLQATDAFVPFDDATIEKVGGKSRFVPSALAAAGAEGKPPTAVPIYSLAYSLYYNKKMFADAGIAKPPATWEELVADGKKLSKGGKWGLAQEGAHISAHSHHAFTFSQQYGGEWFDKSGKPTFGTPQNAQAIKRYVDFLAADKITNPGNAEYAQNESVNDFANGKAAMLLWQAAGNQLALHGMKPEQWGVAPVPFPATAPAGGKKVNSMVAGINIAIFKHSKNQEGALDFVKFMTSDEEQIALNKAYGSLPSVTTVSDDPAFSGPEQKVIAETLATTAAPLPQVPEESQYETLVGNVMNDLFAEAAKGKSPSVADIEKKLKTAEEQVK